MSDIKAVIFDIDGTLTTKNSWSETAIGLGGTPQEDLEIYEMYKAKQILSDEADAKLLAMWKRNGLATKENFNKIFYGIPLRPDAIELINYLKQKQLIICLITGSMDMYAQIIADKLDITDYYYNATLFWQDDGHIKAFNYIVNQGEKKLEQFQQFCLKNNLRPEECAVIGDSENDHLLFIASKKGIAVRTEYEQKELETVAYKIVNNLTEIKEII
jgi:phosphoserine phosphatase